MLIEPNHYNSIAVALNGSQMLLENDEEVALNNLAQRFLDEKERFKEVEAQVKALKKELRESVGSGKIIETSKFTLEIREIEANRMMPKDDFIHKHSPIREDEQGNVVVNSKGEPLRDLSVGTKIYDDHLVASTQQRFYVKRKDKTQTSKED
tara:strand:+ start:250 stop:705 length:456 start_codon:yes stop_codon:yes gene_type:complete